VRNKKFTEEFYLLGYNAVQSVESQLMVWRNTLPPSSGSKNKPSKKSNETICIPIDKIYYIHVRFEVFTVVVLKGIFFWDTQRHIPEEDTLYYIHINTIHNTGRWSLLSRTT
jgi:hypothetical protein